MEEIVNYNIIYLPISIVLTILPFLWLKRVERSVFFYFLPFLVFLFIYCGVGMGWEGCPASYVFVYGIYMFVLGMVCKKVIQRPIDTTKIQIEENRFFCPFVNKNSTIIIVLYLVVILAGLAANGKLGNIISPPSVSLSDHLDFSKSGTSMTGSPLFMIMYYVRNLIFPFYLLALYKYKNKIVYFTFFLLFPLYLDFASSGYIARSGLMPFVIIVYIAVYLRYPKLRKKLIRYTLIGIPFVLVGLTWYTFKRIGMEFNLNATDAISLLFFEESGYPILFERILDFGFDPELCERYLKWLAGLPLPGFLKGGDDFFFNGIFSEKVTGMSRSDMGFSVLLPGLVGEGVFLFGKIGFVFHAAIVGFVFSYAYRIFSHKQELFLLLYCAIYGAICFSRAGTTSMMPFYFKHLIIYVIIVAILKNNRSKV